MTSPVTDLSTKPRDDAFLERVRAIRKRKAEEAPDRLVKIIIFIGYSDATEDRIIMRVSRGTGLYLKAMKGESPEHSLVALVRHEVPGLDKEIRKMRRRQPDYDAYTAMVKPWIEERALEGTKFGASGTDACYHSGETDDDDEPYHYVFRWAAQ